MIHNDALNHCTACGDRSLMGFEMAREGLCARCDAELPVLASPALCDLPPVTLGWHRAYWNAVAYAAEGADFDTLYYASRAVALLDDEIEQIHWIAAPGEAVLP